jgi:PAS domain S-box-containing protein
MLKQMSKGSIRNEYVASLDEVVAAVPDFIYTFDLEGKFTYANSALSNLLGLRPGEMVGQNFHDLKYPLDLANTLQEQIQQVISSGAPVRAETVFESASGVGYYEYIFVPLFGEGGAIVAVAGTTRDITKRREVELQNEELLRQIEAERRKLISFFEQSPSFICVLTGPEHVVEFANLPYFQLVGHRELVGRPVFEAIPDAKGQGFEELLDRVYFQGETVDGVATPLELQRVPGGALDLRFVDFSYQPLRDSDGNVAGVLVNGHDVTDRLESERKLAEVNSTLEQRIQERTAQLEKALDEMQGFTYSVSHDLRAPLRSIAATSGILIEELGPDLKPEHLAYLRRQSYNANRLAQLIDDLLKLSRSGRRELSIQTVDITQIAFQVADELRTSALAQNATFDIQPNMTALGDEEMVRLALTNLLENACKFSPGGGVVRVRSEGQVFSVQDEGVGFDQIYAHKVFLPFERLISDAEFPGNGIGLANVKRVIERQGGQVWVESVLGQGSTFFFSLPEIATGE